ncbi:helix-turn-helix domain-containing protein [Engelhardtia mirabilis]|uniref:Transcriptional activator FtrA n=1 Tax=Engelhardtia mirabilis TaxID=2528011 RepID=A0A518BN74_9BACT|nr:transcriptional activator FtrA [Planctomycetes bacterium Pla133]QDV02750.1 transcriptional activator FtrA [Planctomycetes bacterium Pla86]
MVDAVAALLSGAPGYAEVSPCPALRPYVRCIWTLCDPRPATNFERVLPDGCCEVILNHADPFRTQDGVQPLWMAVGELRGPLAIAPTGEARLIGIRFEPGGLFPFLGGRSVAELNDGFEGLEGALREALRCARSVAAIEVALLDRLGPSSGFVRAAARAIRASRGQVEIGQLADELRVGARNLERAFAREVGLAPKFLARVERFQAVLRSIGSGPPPAWAELAQSCGYSDQPHLIRDFTRFAGTSPAAYLRETHGLNDQFVGNVQ